MFRFEAGMLLRLGGPLIVNNLAVAGMQFADAVMAGRLGAQSLAAVAVGASVWFLGFSMVLGIMMAISPIVARYYGAKQYDLVGRYTRQGIYLAVGFGAGITLFGNLLAEPLLTWFGIDNEFRALTVDYVAAISCGAIGIFIFLALRFTTEGVGHTRPIMYTSVFALVMNVFLNYVLAFGKFGAPALGAVGLGYASAITMWLVMFALLFYTVSSKTLKPFQLFSRVAPVRLSVLREVLVLGIPISITITAETGLFSIVSVLMGTRGTNITAAHQIAINFASTMFMIPLALSAAATIRVGHLLGAQEPARARFAGVTGIVLCALFMTASAIFMLLFRDLVVGIYTTDSAVKGIAISLLLVAAVFQIGDGVQIGAAGVLRGYKDTRMPMLINVFSFWAVGFPLAFLAAITYRMPPNYTWGGLVAGLSMAAFLLTWRFLRLSRRAIPGAA
ncbi:MAG: MATE family efflux transporter [Pseudomonadota bacterium]